MSNYKKIHGESLLKKSSYRLYNPLLINLISEMRNIKIDNLIVRTRPQYVNYPKFLVSDSYSASRCMFLTQSPPHI